jgi:hypothetical protein
VVRSGDRPTLPYGVLRHCEQSRCRFAMPSLASWTMAIEAARVLAITFASPWNFGFCTPLLQFLALGLGFCLRDGHGCGGGGGGRGGWRFTIERRLGTDQSPTSNSFWWFLVQNLRGKFEWQNTKWTREVGYLRVPIRHLSSRNSSMYHLIGSASDWINLPNREN